MKKIILLFLILFTGKLYGQNYTRDAGLRLGNFFTATYREYRSEDRAIEGMLFINGNGMTVTALQEYFQPALLRFSDNLFFEYGFGAHAGFKSMSRYQILNRTYYLNGDHFTPLIGMDGIIGLDYRFREFPFIIGMDMKPDFEYSTIRIFNINLINFGISLKYKF